MRKSTFILQYPTTYEKNKEDIARLNKEILEASKQRNYTLAKKLQLEYNYCVQVDRYFREQRIKQEKNNEINRLKNAKLADEEGLKQQITFKMKGSLSQYEQRLQNLEQKHQENLIRIENRFSSPRYAAYRPSPNLHHMLKAESFYANQRDFDSAEQYRNLITHKAHQEIIESELNNELSYSAAVEAENHRYEIEKKGLHSHLENEKIKFKTETERGLNRIKHKYSKLSLKNVEFNKKFAEDAPAEVDENPPNNQSRGDNSFFVTTTENNNDEQIGGEENVYKALNDGFSDILQRSEVKDKSDFCFPVSEPQKTLYSGTPYALRKSYSRNIRTARTRRRPRTNVMLSSTY